MIGGIEDCEPKELKQLERRFHREIFPVLTPLAVGPGQPFPYISGLSLSLAIFAVDPETGEERFARVKIPEGLPRFLELGARGIYLPLEHVISHFLPALFPGVSVVERAAFRVTRDADFEVSDDADDLLEAVESQLRKRRFGDAVRVEVSSSASSDMVERLTKGLDAEDWQVYRIESPLDLADLMELVAIDRPDLKDEAWRPVVPPRLREAQTDSPRMFDEIRRGDIVIHQPYESFRGSFEVFGQAAAQDPNVIAMKTAVYRTGDDSVLVGSLIQCAEDGKQSVCLVELKARFDERRNIEWSRALEQAGVHVVHGFSDLKIHAKMSLVVRRERDGLRRYAHIGTGNYNSATARLYEDVGIFTADEDITADVADLFNYITGFGRPQEFRKLLVAPFALRSALVEEIRAVARAATAGEKARIRLKVNHIVDPMIIDELYAASQAGATIDIVARTTCVLRPGVAGLSENIRVRSLVGRFLEHSRLYAFDAGGRTTHVPRKRRPHAAQPRPPHRGARAGGERSGAAGAQCHPRQRARRQHQRVGARLRRRVVTPGPGRIRETARSPGGDDASGARPCASPYPRAPWGLTSRCRGKNRVCESRDHRRRIELGAASRRRGRQRRRRSTPPRARVRPARGRRVPTWEDRLPQAQGDACRGLEVRQDRPQDGSGTDRDDRHGSGSAGGEP